MSGLSRTKGAKFEQKIARLLSKIFPDCRRNLTETQVGQGVDLVNTGRLKVQCKFWKEYPPISRLEEVPRGGDHFPALVAKGNKKDEVIVMYLADFIKLATDIGVLYEKADGPCECHTWMAVPGMDNPVNNHHPVCAKAKFA